jgi:hypothetical protein
MLWILYCPATPIANTDEQMYGQKPPGTTPELYQPEFDFLKDIKTDQVIFSPDGKEICFYLHNPDEERYNRNTVYYMKKENRTWTKPAIAYFVPNGGKGNLLQFSPDGNRISYTYKGDLWTSSKKEGKWSVAEKLPEPINTDKYECGFSFVKGDRFYFAANGRPEGKSKQCDIYCSKGTNGNFGPAINLSNLNTIHSECVLTVDPDEKYIIFTRFTKKSGKNAVDLYIGFRKEDGTWTIAEKLDHRINSSGSNHSPGFSYDGKYFFYSQSDLETKETKRYWINTQIFDEIRGK